MKKGGFYFIKFFSNSCKFLVMFFEKEWVNFELNLDLDDFFIGCVFGFYWDVNLDIF